jgi:hypothetical protein
VRQGWSNQVDLDGYVFYTKEVRKMGLEIWLDVTIENGFYEPTVYVGDHRVWRGFLAPTLEEAQVAAENYAHDMLSACLTELLGLTSPHKEVPDDEDLDLPF